jgi:uncharacterized membrane protein YfcA
VNAKPTIAALAASVTAGLTTPLLFMLAEAAVQGDGIAMDDLGFAYSVVAPFTLGTAFVVAWPSYRLQRSDRPLWRRIAVAMAICAAAGTAALVPVAGEFPWKAGATACATLLLWVGTYHLIGATLLKSHSYRSEPSG